jgi:hypothetical protein
MNIYVSREKKLAILVVIAIVILMMLVGAVANLILSKAGMAPVYFPQVAMIQKEVRVPVYTQARLSHYWPPYGGPNCFAWDEITQTCVSGTASGEPWEDWINIGLACPPEYEFGTVFVLPGGEVFTCVDRGGKVQVIDGIPWLDLLVKTAPVPYGTIVTVEVRE